MTNEKRTESQWADFFVDEINNIPLYRFELLCNSISKGINYMTLSQFCYKYNIIPLGHNINNIRGITNFL